MIVVVEPFLIVMTFGGTGGKATILLLLLLYYDVEDNLAHSTKLLGEEEEQVGE